VSGHTHSLAEWASVLSLGVSAISLIWFALAFAPADLAYFDPRPLLGRAGDRLLVEAVNARLTLRDAAITCAALLALLTVRPEALR
jgi:hypothetical protein